MNNCSTSTRIGAVTFEEDDQSRVLQYRSILQYHLKNMAQFWCEALEYRKNGDRFFLRVGDAAIRLQLQARGLADWQARRLRSQ